MIIKVCGLKDADNLLSVSHQRVDMVGYNFYSPSPRFVRDILPPIPKEIKKAGVFVNASLDYIVEKSKIYQLDFAQLHGDETMEFAQQVQNKIPVIKVFRISESFDAEILKSFDFCSYFLFDTDTSKFGGSGKKFDWHILNNFDIQVPFLLSGGIGPEDIQSILDFRHPLFVGIDINSKFESAPGIKDVEMINLFVDKIRSINDRSQMQ